MGTCTGSRPCSTGSRPRSRRRPAIASGLRAIRTAKSDAVRTTTLDRPVAITSKGPTTPEQARDTASSALPTRRPVRSPQSPATR